MSLCIFSFKCTVSARTGDGREALEDIVRRFMDNQFMISHSLSCVISYNWRNVVIELYHTDSSIYCNVFIS